MKRGGGGAICRLSGRIAVTLVSFRKRMAPSRQCNGATGRNRIIDEFSMPAHEAFDGLPITNRSGCRLGLFAGALIRVLSFSLTGVMNVVLVLQLRNSGSGTRPHPNLATSLRASSSRVNSRAFHKFALPPTLRESKLWVQCRGEVHCTPPSRSELLVRLKYGTEVHFCCPFGVHSREGCLFTT